MRVKTIPNKLHMDWNIDMGGQEIKVNNNRPKKKGIKYVTVTLDNKLTNNKFQYFITNPEYLTDVTFTVNKWDLEPDI